MSDAHQYFQFLLFQVLLCSFELDVVLQIAVAKKKKNCQEQHLSLLGGSISELLDNGQFSLFPTPAAITDCSLDTGNSKDQSCLKC